MNNTMTHNNSQDLRQVLGRCEGASEEATAQGAIRHYAYAQLPECRNDLLLHARDLTEVSTSDASTNQEQAPILHLRS